MQKYTLRTAALSSAILLFAALPSTALAAMCNVDSTQTNATSILINIRSCTQIIGQNGQPLTEVSAGLTATQNGDGINWQSDPGTSVDYVIARGQIGVPCAYEYSNGAESGENLQGSSNVAFAPATRFCSDGELPMLPKPPPVSTATTGCFGDSAGLQAAVTGNPTFKTAIGVGAIPNDAATDPGLAQLAVCAESLVECDNQCYRPANYPANTQGPECVPDADGALPLSCRPCESAANRAPMRGENFCWELSHGADDVAGKFTPVSVTQPGGIKWRTYEGSTCYLFTTSFFGREFSYYTPDGCGRKLR